MTAAQARVCFTTSAGAGSRSVNSGSGSEDDECGRRSADTWTCDDDEGNGENDDGNVRTSESAPGRLERIAVQLWTHVEMLCIRLCYFLVSRPL
jgi:hypothetical protein